ncbi:c-type cytochrome [Paraburkholderia caribensis]|uniref:c-type cytochrome n=1 Tax=Paraburkholderia caribensis TaxID=75105 RepID=UPI000AEFF2C4
MLKRILIGVAAVLLIGVIGAFYFAWRPTIAPISPPVPSAFARELVMRGEVLAAAGFCAECHTAKGGRPFAGGYAMRTGFGTVYSTNITPDPETGIGTWSEEAFRRAMQEGVARDGSHLFPAFPYDHFTRMSDADISALYAYFMTREPVNASAQENTLPFPLGIRALQAGWKLLFFPTRPVRDAAGAWAAMESGRLPRRRHQSLQRLSHAAQRPGRRRARTCLFGCRG